VKAARIALVPLVMCVVAACGDNADSNPCVTAGGVGLDPTACLLPWPSSAFLVADSTTRTGFRVQLPASLMPVNDRGDALDTGAFAGLDGFSPMTTIFLELPAVIDASTLPMWQDPSPSLATDSPTVIVDVDTGTRVAHFAEVEASPEVAAGTTELYIRPAARLAEGHHYVVAIRSLVDAAGNAVVASPLFADLRDRKSTALPDTRTLAFESDVFAPLVAAGIDRASLELAWDFRTASGESAWTDLVAMRDAALAMAGSAGLGCTLTTTTDVGGGATQYDGTFTVPSFLDATLRIARDASGKPAVQGTTTAPWTAIVPAAATTQPAPRPLWLYGHGLFSDHTELTRDFGWATTELAGAVAVATDYTGLTLADKLGAATTFFDLSTFPAIIDQLRQGIINTLLLPRTFAGACAALPELAALPQLSPTDRGYFGNSMGGTLGQTIAALSPDVHRFAIGVGGMDFTVMMPRTHEWPSLESFFRTGYPMRLDRDLLIVMEQTTWDLAESSTFGPHLLADPLPGGALATLLFDVGLYDCDTTNIASRIAANTIGLPDGSFVVYDLGAAALPDNSLPPPVEDGVHECVRRDPREQQQVAQFLPAGGSVVDTCGGACGPIATSPSCLATFAAP